MATVEQILKTARAGNLFRDIAAEKKRKMSCGDVRVAIQLRSLGLIRLADHSRNDVTTHWIVTEEGKNYVD